MSRNLLAFPMPPFSDGIWKFFMALMCTVALYGCGGGSDDTAVVAPPATLGSLNVIVNPGSAALVVTGPGGYTKSIRPLVVSCGTPHRQSRVVEPGGQVGRPLGGLSTCPPGGDPTGEY
jgi:hypothetical protein